MRSHTRIFGLNLTLGCFAVSSGRRHRYRTYASVTHTCSFSHHRRIYFHLLDESHRLCHLFECPSCPGEGPLGDYLFHEYYYSLSYMEVKPPKIFLLQRTYCPIILSPFFGLSTTFRNFLFDCFSSLLNDELKYVFTIHYKSDSSSPKTKLFY